MVKPENHVLKHAQGNKKNASKDEIVHLYREMCQIRIFEETVLENFPKGVFFGTTHTYLGQEANAVGVFDTLEPGDIVFSNHRCHGHFLAYGGDMRALFAEMMGKSTGVCGGRGGSQHLQWRDFYSNGIQGGILPIATGMAIAEKKKASDKIVYVFLGDGTLGEGVVYESLNIASLWDAPILFVLENNRIAQTTPIEHAIAGDIRARFEAFGINTEELDSSDVLEIRDMAQNLVKNIREQNAPAALIIHTYRFGPHSKGDDTRKAEEIDSIREYRDPVIIHGARIDTEEKTRIKSEMNDRVQEAFEFALADPFPIVEKNPGGLFSVGFGRSR
jgi:TPP-dependent pyruvate/acetoin dehydrogenase alpha subunit